MFKNKTINRKDGSKKIIMIWVHKKPQVKNLQTKYEDYSII